MAVLADARRSASGRAGRSRLASSTNARSALPNEIVREFLTEYLRVEFPEDELFEKVVPNYPPIAKRILRDNGIWARTLRRDNVELVTDTIGEITESGVRMADGDEREFDVLIYGTGFHASQVPDADEGHRPRAASTSTSGGTATRARTSA